MPALVILKGLLRAMLLVVPPSVSSTSAPGLKLFWPKVRVPPPLRFTVTAPPEAIKPLDPPFNWIVLPVVPNVREMVAGAVTFPTAAGQIDVAGGGNALAIGELQSPAGDRRGSKGIAVAVVVRRSKF